MRAPLLAALSAALCALACAGAPATQAGPPGGDRLYRSKCAACHRAYPPASLTGGRWEDVLSRMAPRARLTGAERELLLGYLKANARDAPAPGLP